MGLVTKSIVHGVNTKKTTAVLLASFVGATSLALAFFLRPAPEMPALPKPVLSQKPVVQFSAAVPAVKVLQEHVEEAKVDVSDAVAHGWVKLRFAGDGKSTLAGVVENQQAEPLVVEMPAGTFFEAGSNQMVVVRDCTVELTPQGEERVELVAVATRITNSVGERPYHYAAIGISELAAFLPYVQKHKELHLPSIQTAVLALTENLPLSAFAKFELVNGESAAVPHNPAFKTEVRYIIQALQVLKDMGYPEHRLALAVDPQLKIEAMLDPLAHAAACEYYAIGGDNEWAFWQQQLTKGNKATRHYALFGIARYYPEVAMTMLPDWVRENRLDPLFRTAAAKSLAETGRNEALSILAQLRYEYRGEKELEDSLENSHQLLSQAIYNPLLWRLPVDFQWAAPVVVEIVEN